MTHGSDRKVVGRHEPSLQVVSLDDPRARELEERLIAETKSRYGERGQVPLGSAPFDPPSGCFLLALTRDGAVACGGYRALRAGVAEIKRMYVDPARRGQGLGFRILRSLEQRAREAGYRAIWLETGSLQPEAIRLYMEAGYMPIEPYGEFRADPRSRCFCPRAVGRRAGDLGLALPTSSSEIDEDINFLEDRASSSYPERELECVGAFSHTGDASEVEEDMSTNIRSRKGSSGLFSSFGVLAVVIAVLASASPVMASRTPASRAAVVAKAVTGATRLGATNTFCTLAESSSKNNPSSAATETVAALEADYAKLKSEEPQVIALAPSAIKGDFQTLFNYFNSFYAELSSVKFNFLKLPATYLKTLESSASNAKLISASKAIAAYLEKNCGIKES